MAICRARLTDAAGWIAPTRALPAPRSRRANCGSRGPLTVTPITVRIRLYRLPRIDATNLTLIDNINIFDANSATAYGALSTNENGEVGISYMIGGGPMMPSHVVGILTGVRKDIVVANGDRGPIDPSGRGMGRLPRRAPRLSQPKAIRRYRLHHERAGDGSNRDCTPRFVVFGRNADTGGPLGGVTGGGG